MRENRTHGSEGGEDGVLSYPYSKCEPLKAAEIPKDQRCAGAANLASHQMTPRLYYSFFHQPTALIVIASVGLRRSPYFRNSQTIAVPRHSRGFTSFNYRSALP